MPPPPPTEIPLHQISDADLLASRSSDQEAGAGGNGREMMHDKAGIDWVRLTQFAEVFKLA